VRHFVSILLSIAIASAGISFSSTAGLAASPVSSPQSSQTTSDPPPPDKQTAKIESELRKIGIGKTATIYLKNGDELHGTLSKLDPDSIQLVEVDRQSSFTVKFVDIKKVRQGLGYVNVFTGRRVTRPHKLRVAGLIIVAAVIALPIIIVATARD